MKLIIGKDNIQQYETTGSQPDGDVMVGYATYRGPDGYYQPALIVLERGDYTVIE